MFISAIQVVKILVIRNNNKSSFSYYTYMILYRNKTKMPDLEFSNAHAK